MNFVSYAQNFEDVMLWRALKNVENGFYIDIGAQDPIVDSVSLAFYEHGWRGVHVEPTQQYSSKLKIARPDETVLQVAIGDQIGTLMFYEFEDTGLSTSDSDIAHRHKEAGFHCNETLVSVMSLDSLFKRVGVRDIHWLKLDVEGLEKSVLESWKTSFVFPWVLVVESTRPLTQEENHGEWEHLILNKGYRFVYFDGLNRFYVSPKHDSLASAFASPPNIFDGFVLSGLASQPFYKLVDSRAQQAGADAAKAGERATQAETQAQQASERATNAETQAQQADVRADELATKLASTVQELHNVHQANHHHWSSAQQMAQQIQAFQQSSSWRLTFPLRIGARFVRNPTATTRLITNKTLVAMRVPFEKPLARLIAKVLGTRALRNSLNTKLKRWPDLHAQLRSIAMRHNCLPHPRPSLQEPHTPERAESRHNLLVQSALPVSHYEKRTRLLSATLGTVYYYVDHTVLCPTNTGMQRVTRQLARTMLEQGSRLVFVKWHNELDRLVLITRDELRHLSQWGGPNLEAEPTNAEQYPIDTEQPHLITGDDLNDRNWLLVPEVTHINYHDRQLTLDIILAAKRARLRTAFVFYDAIPLRRTELAEMASAHEAYMRQLLQADLIIPISSWSAHDLQQFLIQHEGVAPDFLPPIEPLLLPAEVYGQERVRSVTLTSQQSKKILCVGSIDERKNQILLAQTFRDLVKGGLADGWELVFAGNLNPSLKLIFDELLEKTPAIHWLGNCSDNVLKENYAECAFTVFPSVEEGFGLPIAESLWYGKPCLCANFGPMAEIAEGGGCWTVDMRSPEALRNGLLTLVSDPHLRKSLLQQVNERQFSRWRDYASAVETSLLGLNAPAAVLSKVFYLVDHTCTFGLNTGIQRVVRGLAAALIREGVQLIPAKWNLDKTNLESPSSAELNNFSKWNGPPATGFTVWENPGKSKNSWVLMPELTSHYEEADYQHIRKFLDSKSLRACSIFYDTIPWKLRDLYPPSATKGHRLYMAGLNLFELILPISSYSRDQLEKFYLGEPQPTTGLQRRLIVCPLPGEFKETARSLQVKSRHTDPVEILSVGTLEPRKNHLTLVRAFLQACSTSPRLLRLTLAGGAPFPDIAREVKRLVAEYPAQLCWVESPSDSILKELYESCDFTVYPSVEEGFGLPILESLWHARPCICMSKGAMAEVASGGGCLTVDTRQTGELAAAIVELSQNEVLREQLCEEAITRPFRTWDDYASDCALYMAQERVLSSSKELYSHLETAEQDSSLCMPNLSERPILSVCISTYNRANWLKLSLAVLAKESSNLLDRIELFVCDNASTDATFDVVAPYVAQGSVRYHRNSKNVGMLGNLRSTAQEARGRYIWILGDDDIVKPGAIANVVSALDQNSKLAMVYLNYAYTRDESPTEPDHLPAFFESATPVVLAGSNRLAPIKELVVMNENFFTAIYCIVFERSHALMAYSQYTEGEPFSSLLTCVPTTSHVLTKMMELNGCWLAEPQLVINLNVSWSQHAWRWILQRFPEIHDLAETYHAQSQDVDRWRDNYMPHIEHYLNETFLNINTDRKFQIEKLLLSIKHTEKFKIHKKGITEVYRKAYELQHSLATEHPDSLFMHNQI